MNARTVERTAGDAVRDLERIERQLHNTPPHSRVYRLLRQRRATLQEELSHYTIPGVV